MHRHSYIHSELRVFISILMFWEVWMQDKLRGSFRFMRVEEWEGSIRKRVRILFLFP